MSAKHAIITGPPGVGKTTLVQKICTILQEKNVPHRGFYTQEVRQNGERTGFQIVSLDGEIGTLSSIRSPSSKRVGRFGVEIEEFERISLPQFENLHNMKGVLVIDEIGKMELFSGKFTTAVREAFEMPNLILIATIPIAKGKPIPFVEEIRQHPKGQLFHVDRQNRDFIIKDILATICIS